MNRLPASTSAVDLFRTVALTLAAVAVGIAIHIRDGEYMYPSGSAFYPPIWFIGLAIVAVAFALRPPAFLRISGRFRVDEIALAGLMVAVLVQFVLLIKSPPVGWNPWSDDLKDGSRDNLRLFYGGISAAAALTIFLLATRNRLWVVPFLAIVGVHGYLGIWTVKSCPQPAIDVWYFQQIGGRALLNGENPYTTRYPDIYADKKPEADPAPAAKTVIDQLASLPPMPATTSATTGTSPTTAVSPDNATSADGAARQVYGSGLAENGELQFGFPYLPESLYLSTIGYKLAGDHRYAQAMAFSLAGLLLAFVRPNQKKSPPTPVSERTREDPDFCGAAVPAATAGGTPASQLPMAKPVPDFTGRWGAFAVLLLLFTPRAFFIIGRGWTEPFVVLLLALTLFVAGRLPKLLPIALGLFLASKQYLVFAMPLAWLLIPNGPRKSRQFLILIGGALVVAAAITLPLAIKDLPAFIRSTLTAQFAAPFRKDALSWLAWYFDRTGTEVGSWPGFVLAGLAILASLRWCPRTPAGFALGLSAVYLPFIAFNKQAFANYYLFVIAAIVGAIAVKQTDETETSTTATIPAPTGRQSDSPG